MVFEVVFGVVFEAVFDVTFVVVFEVVFEASQIGAVSLVGLDRQLMIHDRGASMSVLLSRIDPGGFAEGPIR